MPGIYDDIGVTRVINAAGSMTYLGGSLIAPEVLAAMNEAAGSFVVMEELMAWAGTEIARLTGTEAGLVTTGTSGGILLAAAACLTGTDRQRMRNLPDTGGAKNEFVVQKLHRISFDHAVRVAGGRLVEAGDSGGTTAQQIEAAIGEQTAAVFHVVLDPKPTVALERVVAIAHASGVPVIVDAAAELPPVDNLRAFAATGADLVIFSGGKEISGPNDTGILCGRGELVSAAAAQAFPNRGIGRSLKVSKEQIVGLIFALRRFAAMDYEVQMQRWQTMAQSMCDRLRDVEGISARVDYATTGSRPLCIPRTRLQLDEEALGLSVAQVETALEQGQPAVAVMPEPSRSIIWLNPQHLADGEEEVVACRFAEVVAGGPLMNRPATQSNTR